MRTVLASVAAASILAFFRPGESFASFQFDDAFMFVRYAKHFLAGQGFSWNVDDGPAYGATSTLHLFAVTAVRGLTNLADVDVLIAVSMGAALLACAALVALGFQVLEEGTLRRMWAPLAIVPALLLSSRFLFHSRTGMETMLSLLANALLAVLAVAFVRHRSRALLALCVLAGYLSYLSRPDNGIVSVLFAPLFFVASDRRLGRAAGAYAVWFVAIIAVDLFVKMRLFGDAVPLSFFAKRSGFYSGYLGAFRWNPAAYLLAFTAECLPWLLVGIAVGDIRAWPSIAAALGPVLLTFGYYLTVIQIMGFAARFYFPFLPFAMLAAFVAIRSSAIDRRDRLAALRATWISRALLIAAVVLVTRVPARDVGARAWRHYVIGRPAAALSQQSYVTRATEPLPYVGAFDNVSNVAMFLQQLPAGAVVAASEYGYLGSTLPDLTIVDVLGLHDRHIAHSGFSPEYLFSRNPDIIWFPPVDYSHLIKEIVDSPGFADRYEYFPEAFEHGLALNTQSPRFAAIRPIVERAFSRAYEGRRLSDHQAQPVHRAAS